MFVLPLTILRGGGDGASSAAVRARLAQGMADASTVKTAMANYYVETGEMPLTLEDMGLSSQMLRGVDGRTTIRLDEDRVIVVSVLDNRGGVQATMYLEPIGDDPGTTRYTCATGDLKDVEHFFPQCRYDPTL